MNHPAVRQAVTEAALLHSVMVPFVPGLGGAITVTETVDCAFAHGAVPATVYT